MRANNLKHNLVLMYRRVALQWKLLDTRPFMLYTAQVIWAGIILRVLWQITN